MKKIAVFISGNGSNLQALIDACHCKKLEASIDLVVSNSIKAYGLERAKKAGIPTLVQTLKSFKDQGKTRTDYDIELVKQVKLFFKNQGPDLIVLAGFMHILSPEFLNAFPDHVINLHPALPGAFDGINAIERAFEAFKKGEIQETGVMVHKVIPQVDRGQVILQRTVAIHEHDTLEKLQERMHSVEHLIIVDAVALLLNQE